MKKRNSDVVITKKNSLSMKVSAMNSCQELVKLDNKLKKFMMMSLKISKDVITVGNIMLCRLDHKFE